MPAALAPKLAPKQCIGTHNSGTSCFSDESVSRPCKACKSARLVPTEVHTFSVRVPSQSTVKTLTSITRQQLDLQMHLDIGTPSTDINVDGEPDHMVSIHSLSILMRIRGMPVT